VVASSVMKGRPRIDVSDGQQAPLPRVELGLRDHQLNEFQWHREPTGLHEGSEFFFLVHVEELMDGIAVRQALEMIHNSRPLPVEHQLVQHAVNVHSPAGAGSVSVLRRSKSLGEGRSENG